MKAYIYPCSVRCIVHWKWTGRMDEQGWFDCKLNAPLHFIHSNIYFMFEWELYNRTKSNPVRSLLFTLLNWHNGLFYGNNLLKPAKPINYNIKMLRKNVDTKPLKMSILSHKPNRFFLLLLKVLFFLIIDCC